MRAIASLAVAAAAMAFGGCAVAGRRAAEGASSSVREAQEDTSAHTSAMAEAGRRFTVGATTEVASPESTALIGAAVDAAVGRALARLHQDLDADRGRLAADLDAVTERAAAAAVKGADRELDELLGDCAGQDRRACLRREVRALGLEASNGFMEGILAARSGGAALAVFLAGALTALLARAAWEHAGHRTARA
jgi:hypothetical protein